MEICFQLASSQVPTKTVICTGPARNLSTTSLHIHLNKTHGCQVQGQHPSHLEGAADPFALALAFDLAFGIKLLTVAAADL